MRTGSEQHSEALDFEIRLIVRSRRIQWGREMAIGSQKPTRVPGLVSARTWPDISVEAWIYNCEVQTRISYNLGAVERPRGWRYILYGAAFSYMRSSFPVSIGNLIYGGFGEPINVYVLHWSLFSTSCLLLDKRAATNSWRIAPKLSVPALRRKRSINKAQISPSYRESLKRI